MADRYRIRDAVPTDIDSLVAFTIQEALEAEHLELQEPVVRRGVTAAFGNAPLARYWIADVGGRAVGSVSVTTEWSNFHGGHYWWIQSLYILPEHRGTGLLGQLIDHVVRMAQAAGAIDVRLYARSSNERALRAYVRSGFERSPYVVMSRQLSPMDR